MGSFSTVSIRSSTAEQVKVYLDGVPLNQALGGGVDMGDLPLAGIRSVEVYRGAVPGRFGGNSIGGVVHIRTQEPESGSRVQLQGGWGSFGTRELGALASGARSGIRCLGLVGYVGSRNDFRFWDDNGTEYNSGDDEWARRVNDDFHSIRVMAKVEGERGRSRLFAHSSFDLKHQGIPGIGNYQLEEVRSDTWRNIVEFGVFGLLSSSGYSGYRLQAHHLFQKEEYKDLIGETGSGTRHDRNATRSLGARGELTLLFPGAFLTTLSGAFHHEVFSPRDLLRAESRMLESRRRSFGLGLAEEISLWEGRLQLTGGSQAEVNDDHLFEQASLVPGGLLPSRDNVEMLWGRHVGGRVALSANSWLRGHLGYYQRAPSFFELFGDRGGVIGNTALKSEKGVNRDLGLIYRRQRGEGGRLRLAELGCYLNSVRDMIRFVQSSQFAFKPHNIGRARIRGVETRGMFGFGTHLQLRINYAYQQALNRSPYSYYRNKDLPNAPRHVFNARVGFSRMRGGVYYELNRESRYYLDSVNMRALPGRQIHNLGGQLRSWSSVVISWEIRNLTSNQAVDLWGYPLPGRSYFFSVRQNIVHPQ
jgi:iron complex outermembrane receptor protein